MRQEEYEALPETPFFVGVPSELFEAAKASLRVRDVARGRVGLQTSEDGRFLAGIASPYPGLPQTVAANDVVRDAAATTAASGIPVSRPHWVPFAKARASVSTGVSLEWPSTGPSRRWPSSSEGTLSRPAPAEDLASRIGRTTSTRDSPTQ